MSTKISNLPQRLGITGNPNDNSISGEEFFPIVDVQNGINQTFRIDLKELFNTNGVEKVTGLSVTQGRVFDDDVNGDDGNKFFTLEYIDEASVTHSIKIQKYVIEDNDVAFSHIDPAGYITSSEKIEDNLIDNQLTTPKAVDDHVTHRENLLFTNTDSLVKTYFGDEVEGISTFVDEGGNTVLRTPADSEYIRTGSHVLQHFRLNTEVAQDFVNLLDGVKPELDTFKKIEEEFDTIDYSDKIGTSQVNLNQFRIDDSGGEPLFPNRLNIKELAIGTGLITNNAITTDKIRAEAVTGSKIAPAAISNDQIVGLTITEDKIVNATISHIKLSSGSPEWNTTTVNIPNNLLVNNNAVVNGNITQNGETLSIYNATSRGTGDLHGGRALVHEEGDRLSINHESDYTGGVNIRGVVTVQDMSEANILSGGEQAIVTKAYVDKADINLNPIGSDKIQDNAILLRHMSDDSVGTAEIIDDSITTDKIENIGPQWDQTGKVQVSGDLNVAGENLNIGDPSTSGTETQIIIRGPQTTSNLRRGFATIGRSSGIDGDLTITNTNGDIRFGTGLSNDLRLTSTRAFIPRTLTVGGTGSTSIEGTNFTNPALLIGTASDGIAIDNKEIVQKGGNLNLGVTDEGQDIIFRVGETNRATIFGQTGNFSALGDIISETGVIRRNGDTASLTVRGGTEDTNGAIIKLYATNNALNSNQAFYNATEHRFFNRVGSQEILKIDSSNQKVTLFTQGTNPNHLITKGYVDTKKIAPLDLTDGGPNWQSNGTVETENSLYVNSTGSGLEQEGVGVFSRNVYGQRGDSSAIDHTYLKLKGSSNAFSAQITINSREHASDPDNIEIRGSTTQVRSGTGTASPLALDIQADGKLVAPQQSISRIITSNRSLTTKEYVLSEIGKTFPDDNYIRKQGGDVLGTLQWNNQSGNGLEWYNETDGASIKFYTNGDSSTNNRLEFNIRDNGTENFLFTFTPHGGTAIDLLKVGKNHFSYKGYDAWHDGNTDLAVTSAKLANDAVTSSKIGPGQVITDKIANANVTTNKIKDLNVTSAKIADLNVTSAKIADNAVTSSKIPNNSIGGVKLLDSTVTGDKLADNSVTSSKITDLVITNRHIAASAVNGSKIASNSITSTKIAANAVGASQIAANAVGASEIASGAVGTSEIADNSVTEAKLSHVTAGFLLGKGHGEASSAQNLVPIATSVTNQTKHNSVPSTKAVKAYIDAEVSKPKGVLYHVNAIQKSRAYFLAGGSNTTNNIYPNNAVLNYAKSILPNLKSGDRVMVTWGYLTTTAQNGTSYAFQYAQTIYLVNSATSWTPMQHGTVI